MPRTAKPKTTIEKRIYHVEFDLEVTVSTNPGVKQQSVEDMVNHLTSPERMIRNMHNDLFLASSNYSIKVRARKPTYSTHIRRTFKKKIPYVVEIDEGFEE